MKRTVVPIAIAAFFFVAAPALAKPSLAEVERATAESRQFVHGALDAASDGKARRAAARLDSAATYARIAAQKARMLSTVSDLRGSRALSVAAIGADQSFADLSGLIALLPPQVQARIAAALEQFATMRADLVARLTELATQLPEPARTRVLEAIAALHDVDDLDALIEAIGDPEISNLLRAHLAEILAIVTEQLDGLLVELEGLLGMLPAPAAAIVADLLDQLQVHLDGVFALLDEILATLPGGLGQLPFLAQLGATASQR